MTRAEKRNRILCALFLALCAAAPAHAQLTVSLSSTPEATQLAGSPVTLTAEASNPSSGVDFQFSYRLGPGPWTVLRDFYHLTQFHWVTLEQGSYDVRVVGRVAATGETAEATRSYSITSPGAANPVVVPTAHPLVFLYSAPPCSTGWMRVRFRRLQGVNWQYSPFKACAAGQSLNFYVAGLYGSTNYVVQHQVVISASNVTDGPSLQFQSGTPTGSFNTVSALQPVGAGTSTLDSMVLHSFVFSNVWFPAATDLAGGLLWYYREPISTLLRPIPGGTMLMQIRDEVTGRIIREIDLAGNVVRETNSIEVSRQLVNMGHDPIGVFHHEAIRLANGHTLVLASVERMFTDVQGPGAVNVYGEMVIDLDANLQVVWAWNAFDWLDVSRAAILGETCTFEGPGCPALYLAPTANDWLHANTIAYVASDGNLIVSLRHQDWIIKIDYRNGLGTGEVLWRLGEGGDFTLTADPSAGPRPWFSHQHDSMLSGALLVYDNGNTRIQGPGGTAGNSRGQAYVLDESAKTARLVLNFDLGSYSPALGSAERLTNGNFYFGSGLLGDLANPSSQGIEVAIDGSKKYVVQARAFVYRSFRVRDLYRPY